MDEPNLEQKPKVEEPKPEMPQMQTSKGKPKAMGKWLTIGLAVLLVAALAFLGWYWMQAEAEKKSLNEQKVQLQGQLDALKAQTASEDSAEAESDTPCNDTASAFYKENIKAALDSMNTAVFATYTTNPVNYILAASELGKDMTPDEAALALDYTHSATGPWDFSVPAATVNTWKAGFYKDHFGAKRYIGRAASGMVVSFGFDCSGKVNKIFVAADDDLLL